MFVDQPPRILRKGKSDSWQGRNFPRRGSPERKPPEASSSVCKKGSVASAALAPARGPGPPAAPSRDDGNACHQHCSVRSPHVAAQPWERGRGGRGTESLTTRNLKLFLTLLNQAGGYRGARRRCAPSCLCHPDISSSWCPFPERTHSVRASLRSKLSSQRRRKPHEDVPPRAAGSAGIPGPPGLGSDLDSEGPSTGNAASLSLSFLIS